MATKLTLRMDEKLISQAKKYAKKSGKSLSQLVAEFFALLDQMPDKEDTRFSPKALSLKGLLKGASVDEKDYKRHLVEKYL